MAEDETDLLQFPPLRGAWSKRGIPRKVLLSGHNARRVVFGSVNLVTGQRLLLPREHHRGVDFQEFLRWTRWHHPGSPIAMLLDEDSSHTAGASRDWAAHLGIKLLWLPHRSPHLNPADSLWRLGKQKICANWQHSDMERLVRRFIRYLLSLPPEEVLQAAGVLSEHFWLRAVLATFAAVQRAGGSASRTP